MEDQAMNKNLVVVLASVLVMLGCGPRYRYIRVTQINQDGSPDSTGQEKTYVPIDWGVKYDLWRVDEMSERADSTDQEVIWVPDYPLDDLHDWRLENWADFDEFVPPRAQLDMQFIGYKYEVQRAMAYAWEKAQLWKVVQGLPNTGDPYYADVLSGLLNGSRTADSSLVRDLAQRWRDAHANELDDALSWCDLQWRRHPTGLWVLRYLEVKSGYLQYDDTSHEVDFDQCYAWAYLWRHFIESQPDSARALPDYVTGGVHSLRYLSRQLQ